MLLERTARFWKHGFMVISFMILFFCFGCMDAKTGESTTMDEDSKTRNAADITNICQELYEKAERENGNDDLDLVRSIVNGLGEHGYSAVDSRNQINMAGAEQVLQFCETVAAGGQADLLIIEVGYFNEFLLYDLQAEKENVDVVRSYYTYESGRIQMEASAVYQAENWQYTEDGYLMFSGRWCSDSEEQYVLTLSGTEEYSAFRVQPLDEMCRELNRKYLLPIGYEKNNMFLTDWSEDDFGELNFYDIYDIFYPRVHTGSVPYVADGDLAGRNAYRIPKDEFEGVILPYFDISSETLQTKTTYHSEDSTYEYRPRGIYEIESPEHPYPEVTGYTENRDGTITLMVHAVFPYAGDSRIMIHEVVIRPFGTDGVQYVSNRRISSESDPEEIWHTPRRSSIYNEKGYNLSVEAAKKEEAEADCKKMMELVLDIYDQADKGEASNSVLSDEVLLEMQKRLGGAGFPVCTTMLYSNMENYKVMEDFLKTCISGKRASVVVYEIHFDGGIGRMEYMYDGTDMYVLSTNAVWNQENKARIVYIFCDRIKEWRYSDKGWFCYNLCVPEYPDVSEMVDGSCLMRIKPMTREQREYSERCVLGLGYQGNNLLCSDWDADHLSELDYNGMYEYLYKMKYEKQFDPKIYPKGIPKEEFERLIMEYLPVTAEQIRMYAVLDEEAQTYEWVRLGCYNYAPTFFGTSVPEVTDIRENEDGTITLTVDAVCDVVICNDAVITHELTVRFSEDGSFQYLSNKILNNGLQSIPQYQYRIPDDY